MVSQSQVRGAGLSLSVTEYGERGRPTVVLVHGFPDTSSVWVPLAHRLSSELHVVAYDVRGAGHSDAPPSRGGYSLPRLVDDLEAVLDRTSPDAPVHLVAHDWGSVQGWEAVTTTGLANRFASFTSISGPPLEHVALWARAHRSLRPADLRETVGQALHSWYIAYFQLPWLPELMTRLFRATDLWAAALHRWSRPRRMATGQRSPSGRTSRTASISTGPTSTAGFAIPWPGTPTCRYNSLSLCTTTT